MEGLTKNKKVEFKSICRYNKVGSSKELLYLQTYYDKPMNKCQGKYYITYQNITLKASTLLQQSLDRIDIIFR